MEAFKIQSFTINNKTTMQNMPHASSNLAVISEVSAYVGDDYHDSARASE